MGFCQWFRHFCDKINVLKLLKLELIVLVFKQHSSQSQKMVLIRLLTIKDTSGMNLRIPQLLDKTCQYRREDFKNQITITKKSTLQVKKSR